jgi:nitrate/nitrite-specific signal transduction histidine kinase
MHASIPFAAVEQAVQRPQRRSTRRIYVALSVSSCAAVGLGVGLVGALLMMKWMLSWAMGPWLQLATRLSRHQQLKRRLWAQQAQQRALS